ncbi:hypothetical protein [Tardiphaga sp.]|jgi:hypothetical protein|uniref:hypothetical protein n=1 Tax=Tardiphaga sp. TaxID=1926292 RepID=UPI0037D9F324
MILMLRFGHVDEKARLDILMAAPPIRAENARRDIDEGQLPRVIETSLKLSSQPRRIHDHRNVVFSVATVAGARARVRSYLVSILIK